METKTEVPAPPLRRPLRRRATNKLIAGVAGGIADHFDIDVTFVRLGFVLLTVFAGAGIVLYLAAWWIVPSEPGASSAAERTLQRLKDAPGWTATALVLVGLALLSAATGVGGPGVWGAAFVLVGVVMYREATRERPEPEADATPVATPGTTAVEPAPSPPDAQAPRPPRRRRRRRERSGLGWATLGLALLSTGLVAVLAESGSAHLELGQILALPLAILGIGLLIGTVRGRAKAVIPLGLLLIPPMLFGSLIHVPIAGGVGERLYRPTSAAEVLPTYRMAFGTMVIDLSDYPFGKRNTVTIHATIAGGTITVHVPRGLRVVADGRVELGSINLSQTFRRGMQIGSTYASGFELADHREYGPPGPVRITLDLQAGIGDLNVFEIEEAGP